MYVFVREQLEPTSDVLFACYRPDEEIPDYIRDGIRDINEAYHLNREDAGRDIYKSTGYNGIPWDTTVSTMAMDDCSASPYVVMDCFPIINFKLHPYEVEDGFDPFTISPHDFHAGDMMGTFGASERETSARWLLRWAQHHDGWADIDYDELCKFSKHRYGDFRFNDLDSGDGWFSCSGRRDEWRGRSPICVQEIGDNKYRFTHAFIQRCLNKVERSEKCRTFS